MSQNQRAADRAVKSMPCIETPPMMTNVLGHGSYNASVAEREGDKPSEKRPSVKSLVNKYGLIEQKLRSARLNSFDTKKKSFTAACERLCSSYKDCVNMEEGDTRRVENVESFVKNHVYNVFNTTTYHIPQDQPIQEQNFSETVKFDFKTGISELDNILNDLGNNFWEQIVFMIKINRDYYESLTQIMDTRKFRSLRDVRLYISSELKKNEQLGFVVTELTPSFKKHLEKFTEMLDTELNEELPKLKFLSYRTKINVVRNEIEEIKRNMKVTEMNIKLLQKEKKDLMNILESYNTENVHKVPLEKRLKSEQEKHFELQAMVSTIFKNKMPFCLSQVDKSNYSVCRSQTSDLI